MEQKNSSIGLSLLMVGLAFLITGCAQHSFKHKVVHPGSYDLIHLGTKQIEGVAIRSTQVKDKVFHSYQRILGPTFFSAYLLEHTRIEEGETVLDVGTGSGVQAIFAAEKAKSVLATDIDELALKNTLLNARRFDVEDKISVRQSDLFNALKPDEKFDVIIASIPYAWDEETQNLWGLQERFFADVGRHLNPDGRIYFLTGWLKNLPRTRDFIERNNLRIIALSMGYSAAEFLEPMVYVLQHKSVELKKVEVND